MKLALGRLLPERPDMVISGINAGPNVGPDILYSGTVGAATEAAHEDLPSMAVSQDLNGGPTVDPLPQARHAVALAERVDWARLGHRRVLNVNYPPVRWMRPWACASACRPVQCGKTPTWAQRPARRAWLEGNRPENHRTAVGQRPAQPGLPSPCFPFCTSSLRTARGLQALESMNLDAR